MPEDLLHDLDESQRRAVTSQARPLAILAPAGSGKTRVLTRRIAWRVACDDAEPRHVLALTFTRKAAGELRDRLTALGLRDGVAAGTFHGIAYAQLRTHWADQGRRAPSLLNKKGSLLADVLGRGRELPPAALASEIEWAKARLLGPDRYAEGAAAARRRTPVPPERIADLYARYEELKQARELVDFDDLLKLCGDALEGSATFAAAQRWRFRHLFVDEFQDVNPLQLRLLDAWRGDHHDLCVVGDPQQAIYGWNGADAGFLEGFQSRYPPAEVIRLERNYRSTPQVLTAAQHVLRRARLDPTPVRATQLDGPPPRLHRYPTDIEEAQAVARAVRDHRTPRRPWSAQAVLVRTHAQIGLVTEALRVAGIPYTVRGSGDLLDRPGVRAALDLLRRDDRPLASCLPDLDALVAEVTARHGGTGAAMSAVDDDGDDGVERDGAVAGSPGDGEGAPSHLVTVTQLARDHLRIDSLATGAGFRSWLLATVQAEGLEGRRDAVTVATFHAAKGLEWPVVHLAGLEDGFTPIGHARTTAERNEEARLLYVAMTRAITSLRCTWAGQRSFNGRVVERRVCPWLRDLGEVTGRGSTAAGAGAVSAVGVVDAGDDAGVAVGGAGEPVASRLAGADTLHDLGGGTGSLLGEAGGGGAASPAAAGAPRHARVGDGDAERAAAGRGAGPAAAWRERLAEQRARLAAVRPVATPALAALQAWRDDVAHAARVPPTAVLDDELLERVAAAHPRDRAELEAVPGMGRLLAARIGDGLLAALAPVDGDVAPVTESA